jgi:nucleoside 2-deoxyribosyltransferase
MTKGRVYLAGPISGMTGGEAVIWRIAAKQLLAHYGVEALSPMRDVLALMGKGVVKKHGPGNHPLTTDRGIIARDRFDVYRADVILANLVGAKSVSIGTVMEVSWAHARGIPVVAAMEPGNIHEHGMLDAVVDFRTDDLQAALEVSLSILNAFGE